MKELSKTELSYVNGGWVLVIAGIAGAFVGGYIAGRQAKEKRLIKDSGANYREYCKDNPNNCA